MYLKDLLKYRNVWLGIAMIWIVLYHTNFGFDSELLRSIKSSGYGGVDICLFASGIGCYYSLSKDPDAAHFLKRRIVRIMPTYWIFIICWLVYRYVNDMFKWDMAIGNIFAVQNFTTRGNEFNWYISAILLFYILTPYFKRLVDRLSFFTNILIIGLLIVFTLPFWNSYTFIITVTRLPIYYMGVLCGKLCLQNKRMKPVYLLLLLAMFIAGVMMWRYNMKQDFSIRWYHGLYWYPFILITPPLCVGLSYMAHYIGKIKVFNWLIDGISIVGKYSFEVYLVHILLMDIIFKLLPKVSGDSVTLLWVTGALCLFLACFALSQLARLFRFLFSKLKDIVAPLIFDKNNI